MSSRVWRTSCAVALAGVVALTSACGSSSGDEGSGGTFSLRIATTLTADSAGMEALNVLAKDVEADSDGRLKLEVFPDGQLGTEPGTLDQVSTGSLDGAQLSTAIVESKVPSVGVIDLPGNFVDTDEALTALNGPVGQELEKRIEDQRMKVLAWHTLGFRGLLSTRQVDPLHMDGLKVRVPSSQLYIKTLQELGANAVPIDFTEVFTSMQSGVVDAVEASPDILLQFNLDEVAQHFYSTNHLLGLMMLVVNLDEFNRLPADLQKILVDNAKSGEEAQWTATAESTTKSIDSLRSNGVEISDVDQSSMRELLQPVAETLAQDSDVQDLYEQLKPE
ncbi:TRAP transporter substrate-binding protein [Actinophytocola sp.]|uniref:TRAP transporter substrate-binding protein n=1 Tax=Actinophytocola sp. TaxID=1872138 RepID=UPI003D6B68CD